MRILLCCQLYAPSVGGVQEVIRQIAERLVERGHDVTVATTALSNRSFECLNGVQVRGFVVSGNLVTGMAGALDAYRDFVRDGGFDVVMIYAAQQWTFDALWEQLPSITAAKVFVPCGFAGLYEPGYKDYFARIRSVLGMFDRLVFNATNYRDIEFARAQGLDRLVLVPNAASEEEFDCKPDPAFRSRHQIGLDDFVFLTVGSFTGLKGHQVVVDAFEMMEVPAGQQTTLILNGNEVLRLERSAPQVAQRLLGLVRTHGWVYAVRQALRKLAGSSTSPRATAERINARQAGKRVQVTDLPREELVQAFMATDLFVFASNIEYSPLVLFESAAAGTPFLTVDVGNALEIACWTGAGIPCPSSIDERGYTRVEAHVLAAHMATWMRRRHELLQLGRTGRERWRATYTWGSVAERFEKLFNELTTTSSKGARV